jgi:F-type H+-transporting ATPase subunit a
MRLSPDEVVFWQHGFVRLNLTIVTTWALMLLLSLVAILVTRRISPGAPGSRWQNTLEIVVLGIKGQIEEVGLHESRRYLPFLGTLFLLVATANVLAIVPGYEPPTGSLSTTVALALCVFVAVPVFGIAGGGLRAYLRTYAEPTILMAPFNVISELSRTVALAIRLFGNVMSGAVVVGILLSVAPFFFPIVLDALGLLTGLVQAYIFSVLAAVYIAAATRARRAGEPPS